jgi:hypothetical protein
MQTCRLYSCVAPSVFMTKKKQDRALHFAPIARTEAEPSTGS